VDLLRCIRPWPLVVLDPPIAVEARPGRVRCRTAVRRADSILRADPAGRIDSRPLPVFQPLVAVEPRPGRVRRCGSVLCAASVLRTHRARCIDSRPLPVARPLVALEPPRLVVALPRSR
jgi:hypothetical protein